MIIIWSPKHFSISGGMGAALLKKPEIVKDVKNDEIFLNNEILLDFKYFKKKFK